MATKHATLADNATTNVNIGNKDADNGVIVTFALSRGALYQAGKITVLNEDTVNVDYNDDWFGDDVGLTIAADISGNNIRLNMAVDNSSADDITFNYNTSKITL